MQDIMLALLSVLSFFALQELANDQKQYLNQLYDAVFCVLGFAVSPAEQGRPN